MIYSHGYNQEVSHLRYVIRRKGQEPPPVLPIEQIRTRPQASQE